MRQLVSRRRHRLGVAALVGLLGWVGLGEQSHGQSGAGGIRLAVYYGPVNCPGRERGPRECLQRPVRAKVAIRAQGADAPPAVIVRTRRDGRGFALLAPGQYVVTPIFKQRERLFPPPERVVTVAPGAFTDVIVDYETGER